LAVIGLLGGAEQFANEKTQNNPTKQVFTIVPMLTGQLGAVNTEIGRE
jgi:hypothetical protein